MADWVGLAPLRKDRIHLYCPGCGRKQSNMNRTEFDPPTAEIAHVYCEKCSVGAKDSPVFYLDAQGCFLSDAALAAGEEKGHGKSGS